MKTRTFGYSHLEAAIDSLNVRAGDVVFSHVGLSLLGRYEGERLFDDLFGIMRERLGQSGTWIVPTFSYSFSRNEDFDPLNTASTLGEFAEWFRQQRGITRSLEPILSVALWGARGDLLQHLPRDCFGAGSLWQRLGDVDAKIVNMGPGLRYLTCVHHIEQRLSVPYRFVKEFSGFLRVDGAVSQQHWKYFARNLDPEVRSDLRRFESVMNQRHLVRRASVGFGELIGTRFLDVYAVLEEHIRRDSWFLARYA